MKFKLSLVDLEVWRAERVKRPAVIVYFIIAGHRSGIHRSFRFQRGLCTKLGDTVNKMQRGTVKVRRKVVKCLRLALSVEEDLPTLARLSCRPSNIA